MYLKRLEIQGFKSFPDKIKLDFDRGITAIVGPNGSGKSNISDAICWVLGEQSARSLRGLKMEDVIFAGTQRRQGRSFAEVIIVLDNSDLILPLSYTEVSITRRMYRSGESEYFINGVSCRLKDIHQLFTDTGLGRDGYSIISQGRVDEILSIRGEDRRMLFEEAAGILKFKNRRLEAEQKIERERANLERVNDIITELESQLEPMERQARTAEKYLEQREYLKLLQVNIFRDEAAKKNEQAESLKKKLDDITTDLEYEESKQRVNSLEHKLAEDGLEQTERTLAQKIEEAASLKSQIIAKENEIKLIEERLSHASANMDRLQAETSSREQKLNRVDIELESASKRADELTNEIKEKKAALVLAQERYNELVDAAGDENAVSQHNAAIIDKIRNTSELKSELKLNETLYTQSEHRREKLDEDKESVEAQLSEKRRSLSEGLSRKEECEKACARLELLIEHLGSASSEASVKASEQAGLLAGLQRSRADTKTRLDLLSGMEREKEGYYKSVRAVLKLNRSGIRGTVGELLYVPRDCEAAVEAALGAAIQNIVTNSEEDAGEAIEYLKKSKDGRVTFMPLTAIKPKELGGIKETLLKEPGVIGTVKNLITYDPVYENIYSNLLGSVIALDTMEHAVVFSRKYRNAYRLVTLQGEVFSSGGAITGGAYKNQSTLVSRSREISELRDAVSEYTKEEAAAKELADRYFAEAERAASQLTLAKEDLREKRTVLAGIDMSIEQLTEAVEILSGKMQSVNDDISETMIDIVDTNRLIRELKKRIKISEDETEELKRQFEEFQNSLANRREMKDLGISELSGLNSDLSGLEQMQKAISDTVSRLTGQRQELIREIDLQKAQTTANENAAKKHLESIESLKSDISSTEREALCKSEEISELEKIKADFKAKKARFEEMERERTDIISNIRAEKLRTELKKEQLDEETRRLHDEIWETYRITRQMANEYESLGMSQAQLQREEKRIRTELAQMGDVNVNAIDACKELKKRYEFLTSQRNDIIEAEKKLSEISAELTRMMEERFLQQFEEISYNFSTVFVEMFGGGTATVKLSDETSVLESGIEIIAQPPGKSLQNMMLLSGGERALTAIALLFGILRMKPSPFCVLDEIEAALDEANSARYARYIRSVSGETQLILVTHKQLTMESADVMYGVTMQEQGISKIIPVIFQKESDTGNE